MSSQPTSTSSTAIPSDPLAQALSLTLSTDANQRHAAEHMLNAAATDHTHASHLLRLAASSNDIVAAAAALRLKNLVRQARIKPAISEASRQLVRADLLPALAAVRMTNIEGVLAETARWLVLLDFPSRWPTLLTTCSEYLQSNDTARVHAALIMLRQLTKCYEFKSRDPAKLNSNDPNDAGLSHPREPLDLIAAKCFPTLFTLYVRLDDIVEQRPGEQIDPNLRRSACVAQRLIVKVFWSSTQFILPPCLGDSRILEQWMTRFYQTMRRPSLTPWVDDLDDLAQEPEWKTKKWIGQVITRFLKRYGSPKKVPVDEPWAIVVANIFKDRHAEEATRVMLQVLCSKADGQQLSKRVAHICLDFIEEAIETAALWAIIRPHVDKLLTAVVFPYLCFSETDEEAWLNDPTEYVRKQYDFTEDFTSPRMAASNLLTKMADLRSKSTVLPFLQYLLQSILDPFAAAPASSRQRAFLARKKVGAFAALAAVKSKLMSKKELSDSFLKVLKSHVLPDLQSEFGFLRSEAAWLLGQVASTGWVEFSEHLGTASLRGCVSLLEDSEVPVQAAAGGALQYLMDQDGSSKLIGSVAPQLLERLLQLMDHMSEGYLSLLPALDKLVVRFPDEIMPLAVPLVQRLMAAFGQSAQGILKDGDDDDDELAFASAQVLHLISSVVSAVGDWGKPTKQEKSNVIRSIEQELQPLMRSMFQESHQVFVEELLDVLACLVIEMGELHGRLSPFLISLVPEMVKGFHQWAADYIEPMMDALLGYLRFDLRGILDSSNGIQSYMAMIKRLWSSKFDDSDAVYGAKIAEMLILNLSKLRPLPEEIVHQVVIELARSAAGRCMTAEEDNTPLRQRLFSVVMLCCYFDASSVLRGLDPCQVMRLLASQTEHLPLLERIHAKKSLLMGVATILCTRGLIEEDAKPHLLKLAIQLQMMIDEQRNTNAQSAEQASNHLASLASVTGSNSISDAFKEAPEEGGSDLEDDQDATNFLDDYVDSNANGLERLAVGTGLSVETLEQLQYNNGYEASFFDFDNLVESDADEGEDEGNPLDDINEVDYLVKCVQQAAVDPWWNKVEQQHRNAMENLARRVAR